MSSSVQMLNERINTLIAEYETSNRQETLVNCGSKIFEQSIVPWVGSTYILRRAKESKRHSKWDRKLTEYEGRALDAYLESIGCTSIRLKKKKNKYAVYCVWLDKPADKPVGNLTEDKVVFDKIISSQQWANFSSQAPYVTERPW